MLGTAFIATHRGSGDAFAQVTGGERHIVSAGVRELSNNVIYAYRIWSDNAIDVRPLSQLTIGGVSWTGSCNGPQNYTAYFWNNYESVPACHGSPQNGWRTVDNGTSGFRPLTDVDMSGMTDAGDISQVLMDFNTSSTDLPPPPIDCTINSPR